VDPTLVNVTDLGLFSEFETAYMPPNTAIITAAAALYIFQWPAFLFGLLAADDGIVTGASAGSAACSAARPVVSSCATLSVSSSARREAGSVRRDSSTSWRSAALRPGSFRA
jgi:hypothetical protein